MRIVNREDFIRLVQHPQNVSVADLESLEDLVKIFPYCQLAHFFIAKAHVARGTMLASKKLQKAAVYATHRDVLKKLVMDDPPAATGRQAAAPEPSRDNLPPVKPAELVIESPIHDSLLYSIEHQSPEAPREKPVLPAKAAADAETEEIRRRQSRQQEIIENFIKTEPRISSLNKSARELQNDRDLSERSIRQPTGLASENLAVIMVRQGKYDKAIEIYEQLIAKNPEKKSYFAEKIQELKNRPK